MKKISLFWVFISTLFFANTSFAEVPTVREQLEKLNKYWKAADFDNAILYKKQILQGDVELIQTHLTLVEQHLRSKGANLTKEQKANRLRLLDTLHVYMQRGIFPKNLYHLERTPYFIDNFGTACAVGQLIISSGYENLAKRISKENNYAYIENMPYVELTAWADKMGFEVNELKWIQPGYCYSYCEPNTYKNVSCYGKSDGCIGKPNTTLTQAPFTYDFYSYDGTQWHNPLTVVFSPLPGCSLSAGYHKWVITDSLGNNEEFVYSITQPDSITTTINVATDNSLCAGEIALDILGGTPPYTSFLVYNGDTLTNTSGLCSGTYEVVVKDNSIDNSTLYQQGCYKKYSVDVNGSSSISKLSLSNVSIAPNPSRGKFTLTSDISQGGVVDVYSITGTKIETRNYASLQRVDIDISQQAKGIYLMKVSNAENVWTQRVIVE